MHQFFLEEKVGNHQSTYMATHTMETLVGATDKDSLQKNVITERKIIYEPLTDLKMNNSMFANSTVNVLVNIDRSDNKPANEYPMVGEPDIVPTSEIGCTKRVKGSVIAFDKKGFTTCRVKNEIPPVDHGVTQALEYLNSSVIKNKIYFISSVSTELNHSLATALEDLITGIPIVYGDVKSFLQTSKNTLDKFFEDLPNFIKALAKELSKQIQKFLPAELIKVASTVPKLNSKDGIKLKIIDTLAKILKSVSTGMRFFLPAFLIKKVSICLTVIVFLFVVWYCRKRGKDERLKCMAK